MGTLRRQHHAIRVPIGEQVRCARNHKGDDRAIAAAHQIANCHEQGCKPGQQDCSSQVIHRCLPCSCDQQGAIHFCCNVATGRQAAALFLIAPMSAVSMAPPAPPATTCEMTPPTLKLPVCAAAMIDGSNNVTTWPSTPPPTSPETTLPIVPRSKFGDALPAPTPPRAPATRLIKICSMSISHNLQ